MLNKTFKVKDVDTKHIEALISALKDMGANIKLKDIFPGKQLQEIKNKWDGTPLGLNDEEIDNVDLDEMDSIEYKTFRYDLCSKCHSRYLQNPLSINSIRRGRFSEN